ncbi:MAG: glycosyltransferase family 39 protein [Bacteroidales bacterium]
MQRYKLNKPEYWLLLLGLLIRVAFVFFIAEPYFGRENIHVDGDTYSFAWSFQSLFETGTYTVNPGLEYGYFGRMPGYPFFMGVFYLLSGQDWPTAFIMISWVQLFLDLFSAWLLFLIARTLSGNRKVALTALLLYCTYPFVIVWTPVVYAETLGVFLTLAAVYFFIKSEDKVNLIWSGIITGAGILVRPQEILLVPVLMLILLFENYKEIKQLIKKSLLFILPVLMLYGSWPLRNYINHNKLIFTQDSRGFYNWDIDVMAFWAYIYSVKSEWDPQYTQIITNQKVTWPKEAYRTREDSLLLEKAVWLSQNCGSGFSHKKAYWKEPFNTPNCNKEIEALFMKLRENQIKNNPLNFYFIIPVENLKKAIFKSGLYDQNTTIRKLAGLLFYYRTLLILAGILFYFLRMRSKNNRNSDHLIPLIFFLILYLTLCAGTSIPLRNIEIRYFLPADVLLLIPAAWSINYLTVILGLSRSGL